MIAATGNDTPAAGEVRPLPKPAVPAPGLEKECRIYTRYLTGQAPSSYIIEKYQDFHQKIGLSAEIRGFDRFLIFLSARGPLRARLVDSYASFWYKSSVARQKMVLTLALIECAPPTFEALE